MAKTQIMSDVGGRLVHNYTFEFVNAINSFAAPVEDMEMDWVNARLLTYQVDTLDSPLHNAVLWDLGFITSPYKGGQKDDDFYPSAHRFNDGARESRIILPGPNFAKIRISVIGGGRFDGTVVVTITK